MYAGFENTMRICGNKTRELREILPSSLGSNFSIQSGGFTSIKVMINDTPFGLSVAYPIDANMHAERYGFAIETALIDANTNIVYNEKFEYEDVRRWSTIDELVAEFNRVRDLLV